MSLLWLNLFIIVPVIAYKVARRRMPRHVYGITGASLGAVIAPISFGLYSWYFVSFIGVVPGMIGLILVMVLLVMRLIAFDPEENNQAR